MKEIVKIEITEQNGKQVVSARELYDFLETKEHFAQWANRMFSYGFEENIDYQAINVFVNASNGIGGTKKLDYALTLDCAKEISMIQRTNKGKSARLYFIECEKKLRDKMRLPDFTNPVIAARAWADEVEQKQIAFQVIEKQDKFIAEAKPKVDFYNAVAESKDAIDLGTAAKVLNMGVGRNTLFEILRDSNILMTNNQPYQKYIDSGHFRVIEQKWTKPDGSTHISVKTLVYQKGLDMVRKLLLK